MQESRLVIANRDLEEAQAELNAKQAELDLVQAQYEKAMTEKQVWILTHIQHLKTLKWTGLL